MSYLVPPRVHFAGRFQAAVSTVNNRPANVLAAQLPPGADVGFNPEGDGDWRFIGCRVTSAVRAGGAAAADDPVLRWLVADSDRRPPAKLVDLDTQQQMASTIFGLEVRICDAAGVTMMRGSFAPAPFTDLWFRADAPGDGSDFQMGACYTSVLSDVMWEEGCEASATLGELRAGTADGLLSIKFNVDGYDTDDASPDFTQGRVVGSIGIARPDDPRHLVRGRRLMATLRQLVPVRRLNSATVVVDEGLGVVHCDLGNALPTTVPGGPLTDLGPLRLVIAKQPAVVLGEIPYGEAGWYERTAGVAAVPARGRLNDAVLAEVAETPLAVVSAGGGAAAPEVTEPAGGLYARPDDLVYRLDAGGSAPVAVIATRYGRPLAGAAIKVGRDRSQLQAGPGLPPVATPPGAIEFPADVVTGADGVATFAIAAHDPGRPRDPIDGQLYGVRAALADTLPAAAAYPHEAGAAISLLVWGPFHADEPPTWWEASTGCWRRTRSSTP